MKKLSQEEFQDRTHAIIKARKIFVPHFTKNISIAFELYQEILAEKERAIVLSTEEAGKVPQSWLDQFVRPECPKCGDPLYLRQIRTPKGKQNKKGWKSCWECVGPTCFYEEYSKKTPGKWAKKLKRRKKDA